MAIDSGSNATTQRIAVPLPTERIIPEICYFD